jgi:hypothetical protein
MKCRTWTVIIVAFGIFVIPLGLQGQTALTIGGNYWHAQRTMSGDYYEDLESKPGNMIGPYVNLRMGKLIIGGSMFIGTFTETSEDNDEYEVDTKRNDLNLSVGLALTPGLNVFFAMKRMTMKGTDEDVTFYWPGYYYWYYAEGEVEYNEEGTLYGGGLSGVIRFPQSSLFLFWSGAYLKGTRKCETTVTIEGEELDPDEFEPETSLIAFSGGIGYQASSNITLLIGYRGDILNSKWEWESGDETDAKENYKGITATLAYTIR